MSEQYKKQEQVMGEGASDEEIVSFLIGHINEPCEVDVGDKTHNIRDFYIREAERLLDGSNEKRLIDPEQIERLKKKIQEYKQT